MASKVCLPDGRWWRHPESHKVWSNYTTCINTDDYDVISRSDLCRTRSLPKAFLILQFPVAAINQRYLFLRLLPLTLHFNHFAHYFLELPVRALTWILLFNANISIIPGHFDAHEYGFTLNSSRRSRSAAFATFYGTRSSCHRPMSSWRIRLGASYSTFWLSI